MKPYKQHIKSGCPSNKTVLSAIVAILVYQQYKQLVIKVITINCTIYVGEDSMCNAIKTEDLKLTAYNSKFNVFNMGGLSGAPLCIIVYMHGMNDTIIQEDKVYLLPSTLTPGGSRR